MNATFANTWPAPADRFRQGCSINDTARCVVAFRIRQENPSLSLAEARRMALQRVSAMTNEVLPIESVGKLSKELEKRDMLVRAEILLHTLLEDRADIPINAIHVHSGLKADLYPPRHPGDELRLSALQRRRRLDYGPPIGRVYVHSPEDLILYKLLYFRIRQCSKDSRDIAAILQAKKDEVNLVYIEQWATPLGLSFSLKQIYQTLAI